MVWGVTSHNRVMIRSGVCTSFPEGSRWTAIPTPEGCEVLQLNVGPTGLVWAALLDGRALVRVGVSRECLQGTSWVDVKPPSDGLKIIQLSVGTNAVWAITQDKHVWFRKEVNGMATMCESLCTGSGWVEMFGRMAQISVAANNQIFAVGADDRLAYYRFGVTEEDRTGKKWRALKAPMQVSRASSSASFGSDRLHRSFNNLQSRPSSMIEQHVTSINGEHSHSAPTAAAASLPAGDLGARYETQPRHPRAWSPVHSAGSVVATEARPDTDGSVWSVGESSSCIFAEDEELGWAEFEASWSWIEAGACTVDPSPPLPNWFGDSSGCGSSSSLDVDAPWRQSILRELRRRTPPDDQFAHYERPGEAAASWVHKGEARVQRGGDAGSWIDCLLELEWVQEGSLGNTGSIMCTGSLTILNADGASTLHIVSLNDITCVQMCSDPGTPRLAIHVPRYHTPVIRLAFNSDALLEEWQAHFSTTCGKLRGTTEKSSDESVWAATTYGDIFVWDPTRMEANQLREDECYVQKFDLTGKESPFKVALHVGCCPGTVITFTGCIGDEAERIGINLEAPPTYKPKHKTFTELENTCLHLNPRFKDECVVRNSMIEGEWMSEETEGGNPFVRGQEFNLRIETSEDAFLIFVNEDKFCLYRHRLPPESACFLSFWGKLKPFKVVIKSPRIILDMLNLYWRQLGGHLRRVESCKVGVTWGIGYDHTPWVYTGGWGGGFLGTLDSHNVHPMTDSQDFRVYENQRWNPVTGYTSAGLPTDRYMWSDATGKLKRTRDQVKLLSSRWQWVSDWMVDFHVPGGADKEGWQYAVDFPASFHANKQFTDYVRRRRWYRRCAIATTGPWQELGHTKLLEVTLEPVEDYEDTVISVWAIASGGAAMVRVGVSKCNPMGHVWEHVNTDQPLNSISCSPYTQVWAIGKKGCAYVRIGITKEKLEGEKWVAVEPPNGGQLKQVSVNKAGIWAVDLHGRLHVRKEVSEKFPEGTHWQTILPDPTILNSAPNTRGFKHVSVGENQVWIVTDGGTIARREGICKTNPAGVSWDIGIPGFFQYVSIKAFS
ncbi:unnamed protein product [Callosobruchus maculatus]|nr:unnamed protein product [Callosobruchus maculatus]